ncbi:heparinase II/III family protein [Aurantiacibacter sp. D1-12]|uniref:heparinase II/III family protein n=1 Tax=Aurantiacibacter sp. D1-12 TaxID=2993658 RepID=UPI00237D0AF3|nr:heparinase II/III family protein [Aurantiacibacter sp. D1-12]MDE1468221.1 heparinase II/III family protein [Aurantiacibacter sp. D1-12]
MNAPTLGLKRADTAKGKEVDQSAIPLVADQEALVDDAGPAEDLGSDRALVVTDFEPPSISAGERFMRMAYRMGVSGSTLVAPFRKPARPRLQATVESPLQGERAAGMALRAGHFYVYGVKAPIAQVDFGPTAKHTPPFDRVLHGFTWLRDLEACAPRQQCTSVAERVLAAWLAVNPKPGKGPAWKVEYAAQRQLAWLVHAPLILSTKDKALRSRVLGALEETARWLDRNAARAPDRLGEVSAWCAIIASGLLLPEGKPRRLFGEAGLIRALGELVGDDGGVLSRSPLAQIQAIEMLVELSACYRATRREVPEAIETVLSMLVPPLLALTHGDGGLGSWQGANAIPADRLAALIEASGVRVRPLKEARGWGYQRLSSKPAVLQFDASPPPLSRHARNGCASTLAFEFSHGDHRLIVNCGGAAAAGGQVPIRVEQGLRATAAHSTLILGDANSTAVLLDGKLGTGVGEVEIDMRPIKLENGGARRLEASHDGYAARFGLLHKRILILRDDGSELRGEDVLLPSGRKGKRGKVPYAIRFHLGRHVEARLNENGRSASLLLPDGALWQFVTGAEALEIEESMWIDGNGRPHPVQQLVIQGLASRGGGNFAWLLKKMG